MKKFTARQRRRTRRLALTGAMIASSLLLLSCGDTTAPPGPIALLIVMPGTDTIGPDSTKQLATFAQDAAGHRVLGRATTWSTSNASVVRVSERGIVTGAAEGIATITASAEGVTGEATISVLTPVVSVAVTPLVDTIRPGSTVQLSATPLSFVGGTLPGRLVLWSSSNPLVATVSPAGLVRTLTEGSVVITADVEGKVGTAALVVESVTAVSVFPGIDTVGLGATVQLSAALRDAAGNVLSGREVSWNSSDDGVATVSTTGLVTGLTEGSIVITATSEGRVGGALLTVEIPVATLSITPSNSDLAPGALLQLNAIAKDAAGNVLSGRLPTWSTSNPAIATVSASGIVTALLTGTATIAANIRGRIATSTINVLVPVAIVQVSPSSANIAQGETVQLFATPRDIAGNALPNRPVVWSSSNDAVARVTSGLVVGRSDGTATIFATSEGRIGTATIRVASVASVALTPPNAKIVVGGLAHLTASVLDATGVAIPDQQITWSSSNTAIATVNDTGLVFAHASGTAAITAAVGNHTANASITVETISFASVRTGSRSSCGLTTSGAAYCWGDDSQGALGFATTVTCGFSYYYYYTYTQPCDPAPGAVLGGLAFTALAMGDGHACGLIATGQAYCWGANNGGQLGDGSNINSVMPRAVSGGRAFVAIDAGSGTTCGLTSTGSAYCWGYDDAGQLGNGTIAQPGQSTPQLVVGGLTFARVTVGGGHSCGTTIGGLTYCWGSNSSAQLGNGVVGGYSPTPILVAGGLTFATISAGGGHSCGVTTGGAGYCWGSNNSAQLGTGVVGGYGATPIPVAGGLIFASIAAGGSHSCAVSSNGNGYCWGNGAGGALGTGSSTIAPTPVLTSGALSFASLDVGFDHSCGMTKSGVGYCWGANDYGQLGTGAWTNEYAPKRVTGQQ